MTSFKKFAHGLMPVCGGGGGLAWVNFKNSVEQEIPSLQEVIPWGGSPLDFPLPAHSEVLRSHAAYKKK